MQQNQIDWFFVPSNDEYNSDFAPKHLKRLEWISGFTGSTGLLVVAQKFAFLFVDSRYLIQAENELSTSIFTVKKIEDFKNWLKDIENKKNISVGYDPNLHSLQFYDLLTSLEYRTKALKYNLIDKIWKDKITPKPSKAYFYDLAENPKNKIKAILEEIEENSAILIEDCFSVCWLLNIRGEDIDFSPIIFCKAILYKDETVDCFTESNLDAINIPGVILRVHKPSYLYYTLKQIKKEDKKLIINKKCTTLNIWDIISENKINYITKNNLFQTKRSSKTKKEIEKIKGICEVDNLIVIQFLNWVNKNIENNTDNNITELSAANKLFEMRSKNSAFKMPSFPTISSFGSNSAIVHYSPNKYNDTKIKKNGLYLIDSGGHYWGGTTDVTRTIAIGEPSENQKLHYTLVLKSHINLAALIFPKNTTGAQLDAIARYHLWQYCLDYGHGTGHGIGNFLTVHDSTSISKKSNDYITQGMILSNEPGYYKKNEYGIRIENMMCVHEKNENFLYFETITFIPFDEKLIIVNLLNDKEKNWLKNYNFSIQKLIKKAKNNTT